MSSTSSNSTKHTVPVDLAERKKKNDAYVAAFKKASGTKKQSVLPSAAIAHTEWAVKNGWGVHDASVWRAMCEKLKFAGDDAEGEAMIVQVLETIELAAHCETHPIGVIHYARTEMDRKVFDLETIEHMKNSLLEHAALDGKDVPQSPPPPPARAAPDAPKKRRLFEDEATQASQYPVDSDDDQDDKLRD